MDTPRSLRRDVYGFVKESGLDTRMNGQILINPSILNADFNDLENEIAKVASTSDFLHLDIMDNIFVPNFTFDLNRAFEIIKFSKLPVDAHLMVNNPDEIAPLYAENGCTSVTFHLEAASDVAQTIKNVRSSGAKVGLAIKPATQFDDVKRWIDEIDMLLIMTVEPGFGGQSFMHDQMPKVKQARSFIEKLLKAKPTLQIDGEFRWKLLQRQLKLEQTVSSLGVRYTNLMNKQKWFQA